MESFVSKQSIPISKLSFEPRKDPRTLFRFVDSLKTYFLANARWHEGQVWGRDLV